MRNLEMLFICLSLTNPDKVMSQHGSDSRQLWESQDLHRVSHQPAPLSSQLSGTNYGIVGTGVSWVGITHYPSGRVQARVAANCHHIASLPGRAAVL